MTGTVFGPQPPPAMGHPEHWGEVTEDRLTRDFVILQRAKGHRFSSDDMATAFVAAKRAPAASRILDLGCGIGSVLLTLAWTHREARLVGIEAQAISFELLQENLRRNALEERVQVELGDLRNRAPLLDEPFELITGTPPYFPIDTADAAQDPQRAYARIEYRGGIDDYVLAAAPVLAPGGSLVICGDARTEGRLIAAADQVGLKVVARTSIVAHAPKPPLFAVWTLAWQAEPFRASQLVLRDEADQVTADASKLRAFSGFGPLPPVPLRD